jgi:hypothetical protein
MPLIKTETLLGVIFSILNGAVRLVTPVGVKQPVKRTSAGFAVFVGRAFLVAVGVMVEVASKVGVSVGRSVAVGWAVSVAAIIVAAMAWLVAGMSGVGSGLGAGLQAAKSATIRIV